MDVADVFDDWARRGRAEGMEAGHGQTAAPLLASLDIAAGTRFLDLGCGNGWAARHAAAKGAYAAGIDASPAMVQRATQTAREQGLDAGGGAAGTAFHVGDFTRLQFPDHHFDIAWSMEALYYALEPDAVLAEVKRVLKPGGAFHMLIDHYKENVASHDWPQTTGVDMVLRSEKEWVAAFESAGFQAVAAQRLRSPEGDAWKQEQGTLHVRGVA